MSPWLDSTNRRGPAGTTDEARPGTTPPAGTGPRIRSAHHLVRGNARLALGAPECSRQRTGDFGSGLDQVRLLRAGERQNAEVLGDWMAKTETDRAQAAKDTRAWAIDLPILNTPQPEAFDYGNLRLL